MQKILAEVQNGTYRQAVDCRKRSRASKLQALREEEANTRSGVGNSYANMMTSCKSEAEADSCTDDGGAREGSMSLQTN